MPQPACRCRSMTQPLDVLTHTQHCCCPPLRSSVPRAPSGTPGCPGHLRCSHHHTPQHSARTAHESQSRWSQSDTEPGTRGRWRRNSDDLAQRGGRVEKAEHFQQVVAEHVYSDFLVSCFIHNMLSIKSTTTMSVHPGVKLDIFETTLPSQPEE